MEPTSTSKAKKRNKCPQMPQGETPRQHKFHEACAIQGGDAKHHGALRRHCPCLKSRFLSRASFPVCWTLKSHCDLSCTLWRAFAPKNSTMASSLDSVVAEHITAPLRIRYNCVVSQARNGALTVGSCPCPRMWPPSSKCIPSTCFSASSDFSVSASAASTATSGASNSGANSRSSSLSLISRTTAPSRILVSRASR